MEQKYSGILLHPTSLPSPYGIGDLGDGAYSFIDFLFKSKQTLWQILPLNPPGYGESPYQSYSAFAGNPLLISLDKLMEEGILSKDEIYNIPPFNQSKVDFNKVQSFKLNVLKKAFKNFITNNLFKSNEYINFNKKNKIWLDNYAFFMALKNYFNGAPWYRWHEDIAFRKSAALKNYQKKLFREIEFYKFIQYIFYKQWTNLKNYAGSKNIKIIGDMPIFVSHDSSDVWSNPELYLLDKNGKLKYVAGVPPDYFSKEGQLWGNPIYNWAMMEKNDYYWWRKRFIFLLDIVDYIRLDHFRGFEAYWQIPAGAKSSVSGKWVKGPGENFFKKLELYMGKLPLIAEDLGFITQEVIKLKNKFNYPGMKVLQFSFEEGKNELLNTLTDPNIVIYTGTHDNDTILGWFKRIYKNKDIVNLIKSYCDITIQDNPEKICWSFINLIFKSNAQKSIVPLQDILCLDNASRMNHPGTVGDNWNWRFTFNDLSGKIENKLLNITIKSNRNR